MTVENSLPDKGAKATGADRPPQPDLAARSLAGAVVTAFAAGPITFVFGMAILMVNDGPPFSFSVDLLDLFEGLFKSSMFGLVGAGPAAIANTLFLGWLARHGRDRLGFAIASGLALGAATGMAACILVASMGSETDSTVTLERLLPILTFALAFAVTGGLMGALHWRIAIRPRRRWRLLQERERLALRAME